MIEANELRIGNMVNDGFTISKIYVYKGKPKQYKTNKAGIWKGNVYQEKGFDKLFPILLTPEWLNKLGFIKNGWAYTIILPEDSCNKISLSGRWIEKVKFLSDEKLDNPFLRFDSLLDFTTFINYRTYIMPSQVRN